MESLGADLREMQRRPLSEAHVAAIRDLAQERQYAAGEMVAELGAPMDRFIYLLDGEIEMVDPLTGERALPSTLGPTQFVGDIAFLYGGVFSVPIRACRPARVLEVDRPAMLDLMARTPELSDHLITVFAARRRRQLEEGTSGLTLLGADQDRAVRRVASFASRNRMPVHMVELGSPEAARFASACGIPPDRPAVIFGRDQVVDDPSLERVAKLLGLDVGLDLHDVDVLIVGGGPAGVAAAVYAGAEGLQALLVEELAVGGQAGTSSRIENYMGFPTGISGGDLVWRGEVQAMKFGTRFAMPRRVDALAGTADGGFRATLNDGSEVRARAVVVATGVQYRRLPLERLADFEGSGVYYAATETEARYCRDRTVCIVGGGNSAGQAAMFLSRVASRVLVLIRGDSLASSMSDYLRNRLETEPKIELCFRTEVVHLHGGDQLDGLTLNDKADGTERRVDACGLFLMVGAAPNTAWLSSLVDLDDKGFVLTGERVGKGSPFETSHPGIFAVGDVRAGSVKRVASAVGEGSVVISRVWQHVRNG
ncbi:MAG TPA: FAD-dependent oxidoreductase [Polyangiaceae bacterium LLY-WYZ-14_1]|nr:FAD-dependent oxidoreductase [Polyangiaceae bacterium LLY-WYZ-14_1]